MSTQSKTQDKHAAQMFYDRISEVYDAIADGGEHVAREKGLDRLAPSENEVVLEIGYGTGHSLLALATRVGKAGKVYGVDISEGMKKVAQNRIDAEGLGDRVELSVGAVPPLAYPDDTFDVVSMSFTLELFPLEVIPDVVQEIKRVLKPGGRVGAVSMNIVDGDASESVLEKTYKWMHRHFPHIVDCQPIDTQRYLHDAGLTLTTNERIEIWTMPVAIVIGVKA